MNDLRAEAARLIVERTGAGRAIESPIERLPARASVAQHADEPVLHCPAFQAFDDMNDPHRMAQFADLRTAEKRVHAG